MNGANLRDVLSHLQAIRDALDDAWSLSPEGREELERFDDDLRFLRASQSAQLKKANLRIDQLEHVVAYLGRHADMCTYGDLHRVCDTCRCERRKPDNSEAAAISQPEATE